MTDAPFPPPPPPDRAPEPDAFGYCHRHPGVVTGVHCTRCGNFVCPDCMIPAPVGYQCPDCVEKSRREYQVRPVRRMRSGGPMTNLLLAAIWAMFLVELAVSMSQGQAGSLWTGPSEQTLVDLGAMYAPAIAAGQYWRFFTAMFLHAGLLHIAMNSYALYILGPPVEETLGKIKFLVLYFVTGFAGGAVSYSFLPVMAVGGTVAVGASGAIVGVFGAFIAFAWRRRGSPIARAMLRNAALIILINALLSIGWSTVDWRAHVGGLLSGFVAGFLVEEVEVRRLGWVAHAAVFVAVAAAGVVLVILRTNELTALFPGLH